MTAIAFFGQAATLTLDNAPPNWTAAGVALEVVGGGGQATGATASRGAGGGGSGAYAKWTGTFATTLFPVTVNVVGNSGGATNIVAASTTYVQSTSGASSSGQSGGAAGVASGTTGYTSYAGKAGGSNTSGTAGGGGAGAAGPHGAGNAGAASAGSFALGGSADNNTVAAPGGAGATGLNGSQWSTPFGNVGAGSGGNGASSGNGGYGGQYGGGAGGGASPSGSGGARGSLAVITYTAATPAASAIWDTVGGSVPPAITDFTLTATCPPSQSQGGYARSSAYQAIEQTGKYYFEVYSTVAPSNYGMGVGLVDQAATSGGYYGSGMSPGIMFDSNGSTSAIFRDGTNVLTMPAWGGGDVLCFAVDCAAGLFWARVNGGNWNNSGTANPATGVGGLAIGASTYFAPFVGMDGFFSGTFFGNQAILNAGAYAYAQAVPSGFVNWPQTAGPTPGSNTNSGVMA